MGSNGSTFNLVSRNVRGLGEKNKCTLIKDAIVSCNASVVCLQESKLASTPRLKAVTFLPPRLSDYSCINATGLRGGVITDWDPNSFHLTAHSKHDVFLITVLTSTSSDLSFSVTSVYMPSDHSQTAAFLARVTTESANISGAWLLAGDFNLTRSSRDKNNGVVDQRLCDSFNAIIDSLALIELPLRNHLYTWSNKQDLPILARLDRVLFNNAMIQLFPNSDPQASISTTSDHIPLLLALSTDIPTSQPALPAHCSPLLAASRRYAATQRFGRASTAPLPPSTKTVNF